MPKIVKITLVQDNGVVHHTEDDLTIKRIIEAFPRDVKLKKSTDVETLHNKFFAMENELHTNTNTGYTKADLHTCLKPLLLTKFKDFPHYFTTGEPELSTKHLNVEGLSALIEQLRSVANDVFGYTFKK